MRITYKHLRICHGLTLIATFVGAALFGLVLYTRLSGGAHVYIEAHITNTSMVAALPVRQTPLKAWLDATVFDAPDVKQFTSVASATFTAIDEASWEGLVATLESCGLTPDTELAEDIRESQRAKPLDIRPANLDAMTHAELLSLRTSERGEGLRSFEPETFCLRIIPADGVGAEPTMIGGNDVVNRVVEHGCVNKCVQADMPYVSERAKALENANATTRARLGVRCVSDSGASVVLVIYFTHIPDQGWAPRRVMTVSLGEDTPFFTPRI